MTIETITKHTCDFCGKEAARHDLRERIEEGKFFFIHQIVIWTNSIARELDTCKACYSKVMSCVQVKPEPVRSANG